MYNEAAITHIIQKKAIANKTYPNKPKKEKFIKASSEARKKRYKVTVELNESPRIQAHKFKTVICFMFKNRETC